MKSKILNTEKALRIVHLTNIPTPYRVNFFNHLNSLLAKKGIELFVVYCSYSEPNRNWEIDKFDFKYKWKFLKGITFNLFGFYLHLNPFIINYLNRLKPDILINAGSWNMPSAILSLLPQKNYSNCIRLFWSEGHSKSVRHSKGIIANLRRFIIQKYDFYLVPNFNSIQFLSNDNRIEKSKCIKLPNTIEEKIFLRKNKLKTQKIRKLAIVASLEKRKGFIKFLSALSKLSYETKSSIHLEIVGSGPLLKLIKSKLDNIKISYKIYKNLIPRDVSEILLNSHGFILPSIIDPNPLSAIEALASGLPLLLSINCGNVKECILNNQNGWTFNPFNEDEIQKTIEIWSKKTLDELNKMGALSSKRYKKYFSLEKISEEFLKEIENISKNKLINN